MPRAERLLELLQLLRRHRRPVSGETIAGELGISLRTLYRDIAALQAQGARIEGAPGLGYLLRAGSTLPPLTFSLDELEALALGSRWVAQRGDERLAQAARDALARIAAVLPADLRHELDSNALLVGPGRALPAGHAGVAEIRLAIRHEHKLQIGYRDGQGRESRRVIWPFALGYFDDTQVVVAWCEQRQDLRHFRTDRISTLLPLKERYPRRRQALLQAWRAQQGMAEP